MGLFDDNYDLPESGGSNLFAKLENGENRFRVLEKPTTGFVHWENQQPTRYKAKSDVPSSAKDVKHFWFFPVWMYDKKAKTGSVKFLDISQKTIIRELYAFDQNEDWGDLNHYDIIIYKDGEGMETSYRAMPVPKSDMPKDAAKAWEAMKEYYMPEELFNEGGSVYSEDNSVEDSDNEADDDELPF